MGPDFIIIGAPKAGTTALHAALASHPEVAMCRPKEPKYWLCDDAPPPHWSGPGDKHSQQEWIWRRSEYDALWAGAAPEHLRGESTPFYLWHRGAQQRIAASLPEVRLIAVVRDPIDRAYSNWMHLWCDGLEPESDFLRAFDLADARAQRGWAPFWRYRELGLYGSQLESLLSLVERERVLVLRYRDLVDSPAATLDRACAFLGLTPGLVGAVPKDNARHYVPPGWRPRVVGPVIRGGAWLGQFSRPSRWRAVEPHLIRRLSGSAPAHRPPLTESERASLVPAFADDIKLLSSLTGDDYSAWTSPESRGSFQERVNAAS